MSSSLASSSLYGGSPTKSLNESFKNNNASSHLHVLCECSSGIINAVCVYPDCLNASRFLLCSHCSAQYPHQNHQQIPLASLIVDISQLQQHPTQAAQTNQPKQAMSDIYHQLQSTRETILSTVLHLDAMISEIELAIEKQHSSAIIDRIPIHGTHSHNSLAVAIQQALTSICNESHYSNSADNLNIIYEHLQALQSDIQSSSRQHLAPLAEAIGDLSLPALQIPQHKSRPVKRKSFVDTIDIFNKTSALNESRILTQNSIYEEQFEQNMIPTNGTSVSGGGGGGGDSATTDGEYGSNQNEESRAIESTKNHPRFEFSRVLKDPNIELHQRLIVNGKYTKSSNHYRLALMHPNLESAIPSIKQWSFRITRQLPHWLGFGMCLVEDAKKRKFQFPENEFTSAIDEGIETTTAVMKASKKNAHRCYLITNHGWMLADEKQPVRSQLRFTRNDIVTCRFDPFKKMIIFYRNHDYNVPAMVEFTPVCWNKLHPCVIMWHAEDAVELL